MRWGICLANIGSFSDPRVPLELAVAAEANGWDGVFIWDHLAFVWGSPAADPWTVLAAIAASTTRVRLRAAGPPPPPRRPPRGAPHDGPGGAGGAGRPNGRTAAPTPLHPLRRH